MKANFSPLVTAGTVLDRHGRVLGRHSLPPGSSASRHADGVLPKTSIPNVEVNVFWDGIFHAVTWMMTALGIAMLFQAGRREDVPWSEKILVGAVFLGWGLFNLVEGIIDHHVLQLHHVLESAGLSVWDWAFLASGVVFIAFGWTLIRAHTSLAPLVRPSTAPPQTR